MTHQNEDLGEMIDYARIGFEEDLYRLMEIQEVSQANLAKAAGVSPAFISKVFNGNGNYILKTMAKLGRALGGVLEVRLTLQNEEVVRIVSPETARLLDNQGKTCRPPVPEEQLAEVVDLTPNEPLPEQTSRKRRQG